VKLCDLSVAGAQAFADSLRHKNVSPVLVRKIMNSLSALIAEANRRGLVARNVVREVRHKRGKGDARHKAKLKVGVDIPAPAEIAAILGHAGPRWRPLLLVAAFTGLRSSELRGLKWSEVDLETYKLHVTQRADEFREIGAPKSAAGRRTIPFGPIVANTLKEWKLACPHGDLGLVFPNSEGTVIARMTIITGFIRAVRVAGVLDDTGSPKYTGLHCLRHFYASWCIDRGLPPKVIQTHLGHTSITMTFDRYGHLFPDAVDAGEIAAAELRLVSA
jgi:integrase